MGAIRTPHGTAGFILWQIAAGSSEESWQELFINPITIQPVLSEIGRQTHLKLIIVNNITGKSVEFFEFENSFGFDDFSTQLERITSSEDKECDMPLAVEYIYENYSSKALREIGEE